MTRCCCWYICCPCLLCCPSSSSTDHVVDEGNKPYSAPQATAVAVQPGDDPSGAGEPAIAVPVDPQQEQEAYEDLQYLAMKRDIRVTIRKGTQAGVAAGLAVMAGVIVAGPVGAAVGGAAGTAMAVSISKKVVPLQELLQKTPPDKRHEVMAAFNGAFREEFMDTIQNSPELKLLMSGHSIFGVVRYMMDKELIHSEQLQRLDGILKRVF